MKKTSKILSAILIAALSVAMCVSLAACGSKTSYTVDVDGSLGGWKYNFVNINAFGDDPWGMINIEDWGNKKFELGSDGSCVGTGCKWSVQLDIEGDQYNLYLTAHIKGNGTIYKGEGDYTYMFQGAYTAEGKTSYKLAAPTYVKVSLTEGFELITDDYDFADYIPTGPWSIDSNAKDDDEFVTGLNNNSEGTKGLHSKLLPSTFNTIFGGATFNVSGNKIVSITDVNLPQ